MFGAAVVVIDSINRQKSNRSLVRKDRGAFNIKEKNAQFITKGIQAEYKKATPAYMAQLRTQIAQDVLYRKRRLALKLGLLVLVISGLSYFVWGFTF